MKNKRRATEHKIKLIRVFDKNLMSLKTFLIRNEMRRSAYYKLQRAGLGPREIRLGRSVYISYREEARWTMRISKSSADEKLMDVS